MALRLGFNKILPVTITKPQKNFKRTVQGFNFGFLNDTFLLLEGCLTDL